MTSTARSHVRTGRAAPRAAGARPSPKAARGVPGAPQAARRVAPLPMAADVSRTIAESVAALQYELADIERAARGLLRVTIDRRPGHRYVGLADETGDTITVQDCERVTRQLQYALEVDGADYARLEVSSPGLDRPLRQEADYQRFTGREIALTLREPFQARKHWRGVLTCDEGRYGLVLADPPGQVLGFQLAEVREARLVPVIDFKGRKAHRPNEAPAAAAAAAAGAPTNDGGPTE